MNRKTLPIQEGDVIIFRMESAQAFWKRLQKNLKQKQDLIHLPIHRLQEEQTWAENELAAVEEDLEKSPRNLQFRSEDMQIRQYLARVYEVQKRLDDAIAVLEPVPEHTLDCPEVYVQLISLYECIGEYQKAFDTYGKVVKPRPAICLRLLPPTYREFLVCGISGQTARFEEGFDEFVRPEDDNLRFLKKRSVIRLGFLARVRIEDIPGSIGAISEKRHKRLLEKLGEYLKMS